MAKILLRINFHGLENWNVAESAEQLLTLIAEANKNRSFFAVHNEGSIKYINPDFVAYIYPDQVPDPVVEEITPSDDAISGSE